MLRHCQGCFTFLDAQGGFPIAREENKMMMHWEERWQEQARAYAAGGSGWVPKQCPLKEHYNLKKTNIYLPYNYVYIML